jgi:phosphopentomutase
VLDGVGIGELPDAHNYNDEGSSTLSNLADTVGGLHIPNLQKLGLGNITFIKGVEPVNNPLASFGKLNESSKGKDSTTGHWELGGIILDSDFSYFHSGFPQEIINQFLEKNNLEGYLGNVAASGTEIIQQLGDEHVRTGYPIVYTSADSVFQIASHEEVISLKKQYEICKITREQILIDPYNVARVIARPFLGKSGNYSRTTNRKDFSLSPPSDTILDIIKNAGIETIAIGKINDLFNHRGISVAEFTKSNSQGCNKLLEYSSKVKHSLIFANLVDFDVYFGHRNDPKGFASALIEFDSFLPELLDTLDKSDRLIITADHGNDPTTPSTDHSREYVPLIYFGKDKENVNLGIRKTFADVAKTVADYFNVNNDLKGKSFLNE